MHDVVIVAATRTPIGSFQGSLAKIPADELGACVVRALLHTTELKPEQVDELIMGQALTAGSGQNPARQAALKAGLPVSVPALTINKVCGSGLKSVHLAAQAIRCGDAQVVIAGGQENMSLAPYVLPKARTGLRMGHTQMLDSMVHDGLWDAFHDYHMGITAENLVDKYGFSRTQLDEFAADSQAKAAKALADNRFSSEITPVETTHGKAEPQLFSQDEQPRPNSSLASLSKLRPAFKTDGSVTAGNSSTLNDGAAAVLLMSAEHAKALNLPVLARIAAYASVGVEPSLMGSGPIAASQKCLTLANWQHSDLELIEANEAFAAQAMAVNQDMGWDTDIVNVNGGAIALGHPIGASGCRILVSLVHEMQRRDLHKGLATLCIGGGQGVALAIER